MKEQENENKITRSLRKGTERAACSKEQVRRAVFGRIDEEKETEIMRKRKTFWIKLASAAAAVALITLFMTLTPSGKALAAGIASLFAPEKPVVYEIEGEKEPETAELETNTAKEIGYVIYIDSTRYHKESEGGMDYIKANKEAEDLPPVRMEISQIEGEGAEAVYAEMLEEAKQGFPQIIGEGHVSKPVGGWHYMAYGEDWDSPYESVYVVDNTAGGCFVIRCRMFTEAVEGHGARFDQMLETFEVVPSEEIGE